MDYLNSGRLYLIVACEISTILDSPSARPYGCLEFTVRSLLLTTSSISEIPLLSYVVRIVNLYFRCRKSTVDNTSTSAKIPNSPLSPKLPRTFEQISTSTFEPQLLYSESARVLNSQSSEHTSTSTCHSSSHRRNTRTRFASQHHGRYEVCPRIWRCH